MKAALTVLALMALTQAHAEFAFPEPLPPASKQIDVTVRMCRAIGSYLPSKDIGLLQPGAYKYLPHLTSASEDSTFDLDVIESSPDGKAVVLNRIQNGQAGAPILLSVPSLKRKLISGAEAKALS